MGVIEDIQTRVGALEHRMDVPLTAAVWALAGRAAGWSGVAGVPR